MRERQLRSSESASASLRQDLKEKERKLADVELRLSGELRHSASLAADLHNVRGTQTRGSIFDGDARFPQGLHGSAEASTCWCVSLQTAYG